MLLEHCRGYSSVESFNDFWYPLCINKPLWLLSHLDVTHIHEHKLSQLLDNLSVFL